MTAAARALTAAIVVVALVLMAPALVASAGAEPIDIAARSVALDSEDPSRTRLGQLIYRGGLALRSSDDRLGGLSALLISDDGRRLIATTDRGRWFTATLRYDAAGRLAGIAEAHLAPMTGASGKRLRGRMRDAEALALTSGGALLVGLEQKHRILRYSPPAGVAIFELDADALAQLQPQIVARPQGLKGRDANQGVEALATLADGRVLAIAEGDTDNDAPTPGWLFDGDRELGRLGYARAHFFRATGATRLPGGDLLVVERRFTIFGGFSALIRRIAAPTIQPGAPLNGPVIGELVWPATVDNMEGIAARRDGTGETLIYLISDDNFRSFQRTLLLMFALADGAAE